MFRRILDLSNVWLRCQRRIATQNLRWTDFKTVPANRPNIRHQSTATAKIDQDDDHDFETHNETVADSGRTYEDAGNSPPTTKHINRKTFKIWRPHATAKLGMDVLGKPAEVLLLNPRDRKIEIVPQDQEQADKETKESFYEALTSEKEPLSWDQVRSYIEHTRQQIGQLRGQLEVSQWTTLHNSMRQGFKLSQLMKYLRETRKTMPNAPQFHEKGVPAKGKVIEFIARELWGYSLPERQKQGSSKDKSIATTQAQKLVQFEKNLDAFQILSYQHGRDVLRNIALLHSVETLLSFEKKAIVIKGESSAVSAARIDIEKLKQSVKTIPVVAKGMQESLVSVSDEAANSLLQDISARHGVLLRKDTNGTIKLTYSKTQIDVVQLIQRDLKLSLRKPRPPRQFSILPSTESERSKLIPVQLSSQLPWFHSRQFWNRLHDTNVRQSKPGPIGYKTEAEKSEQKTMCDKILRVLNSGVLKSASQHCRIEYSAHFGQSLFAAAKGPVTTSKETEKLSSLAYSTFANDIPLLPRLLGGLDQWSPEANLARDTDNESSFTARLLYLPEVPSPIIPQIEVFLLGDDPNAGLKQNLRISRVSLVHAQTDYVVMLPDQTVDVRFTRQTKRDLFTLREPSNIHNPRLLQFMADHLGRSKSSTSPDFSPNLRIPADHIVDIGAATGEATEVKPGADIEAGEKPSNTKTKTFVLESADIVTSDAYTTPITSRFALEHIGYEGGIWGVDRQECRLVETPTVYAPAEQKLKFYGFFNTAINIAERLNELARKIEVQQEVQE